MPLQNRVAPDGALIATAARGTFMGNRGVLHDEHKRIVRASRSATWLICLIEFRGRAQEVMRPNRYTQLFFLDEAVALAAGHRPCAECRRAHYRAYLAAAGGDASIGGAKELDRMLNDARREVRPVEPLAFLPDGVIVDMGDKDFRLVWRNALHRWTPDGYTDSVPIGTGARARVVTPRPSVTALRNGYPLTAPPPPRRNDIPGR